MKVGFFIQNSKRGGLDTFLINLINNFGIKHQIFIFYNKHHEGIIDYKKKINIGVKYIPYDCLLSQDIEKKKLKYLPLILKKILRYLLLINSFTLRINYFKKKFVNINLDRLLIINGGYQGGESCNSALFAWKKYKPNNPAWYSFHNYVEQNKNYIHFIEIFLRYVIDIKISKSVAGFISVSNSCLRSLNQKKVLSKNKKKVIYNGLSVEKKLLFKKKSTTKNIIMLAVYEERKGFKYIIDAFKILKKKISNCKLYIYGDGNADEKSKIINLIKKNNLIKSIILKKFEKNTEKIYNQADLVVIPSQYNESFGYVAIEAFDHKKPVIACKTGGLKEVIVDNISGFLVNKNKPEDFSNKMYEVLTNNHLRKKLIKNGSHRLQKYFTAKKMANRYLELIINDR